MWLSVSPILGASAMVAAAGFDQVSRGATVIGVFLLLVSVVGATTCLTRARSFDEREGAQRDSPGRGRTGNASGH